ncbi:MAG: hypothetical protein KJ749_05705 [Planctomycetes bacterium]|nr:hypothetical protein [Planctomycetota bacterium]
MNRTLIGLTTKRGVWIAVALAIGTMTGPQTAEAGHRRLARAHRPQRVLVPREFRPRPRAVVVPVVYEDQVHRVWREPVYEIRRVAVGIPAETVIHRTPRYDFWGDVVGYDVVEQVIRPAHTEWREEQVLVQPGGYEIVGARMRVGPAPANVILETTPVRPAYRVDPWLQPARRGPDRSWGVGLRTSTDGLEFGVQYERRH